MENASKALIIAGAILLSILIISLGIMIFNQAQDAMGEGGISDAEITAFNNKFLKYEGKKQGSTVKNLIQEVNVNNSQDGANGINIEGLPNDAATSIGDNLNRYATKNIINTETYTITVTTDGKQGRVKTIKIEGKFSQ